MSSYVRYAVFVVPQGAFYRAGADWLGWDSVAGVNAVPPALADLPRAVPEMTARPRKYGFHGTIKPPFRLADGMTEAALRSALSAMCRTLAPVSLPALVLKRLGGFVAIVPAAPSEVLTRLAAQAMTALDPFRAPPSEADLTRRSKPHLSDRQAQLLRQWGYPYVLEEFRFHLTLTDRLGAIAGPVAIRLAAHFAPVLPTPFVIDSLCLMGEDDAGMFHLVHRDALAG